MTGLWSPSLVMIPVLFTVEALLHASRQADPDGEQAGGTQG